MHNSGWNLQKGDPPPHSDSWYTTSTDEQMTTVGMGLVGAKRSWQSCRSKVTDETASGPEQISASRFTASASQSKSFNVMEYVDEERCMSCVSTVYNMWTKRGVCRVCQHHYVDEEGICRVCQLHALYGWREVCVCVSCMLITYMNEEMSCMSTAYIMWMKRGRVCQLHTLCGWREVCVVYVNHIHYVNEERWMSCVSTAYIIWMKRGVCVVYVDYIHYVDEERCVSCMSTSFYTMSCENEFPVAHNNMWEISTWLCELSMDNVGTYTHTHNTTF